MSFSIDEALLMRCLSGDACGSTVVVKECRSQRCVFPRGTNDTCQLFRASVAYERDGRPLRAHLVFKVPVLSEYYDVFKALGMYDREAYVYAVVLPGMASLASCESDAVASPAPRHYLTTESGVLVLHDLRALGYRQQTRAMFDFERSAACLRTLAAFHARSVRLVQRHPAILQPLMRRNVRALCAELTNEVLEATYPPLEAALRRERVAATTVGRFVGYADAIRRRDDPFDEPAGAGERGRRFEALCHGGLKRGDIFFAYDDAEGDGDDEDEDHHRGPPADVKLIDYQVCRWSTPVLDWVGFGMLCVDYAVYEARHDELLARYLAALNETLAALGCGCRYTSGEHRADMLASRTFQVMVLVCVGYHAIKEFVHGLEPERDIRWLDDEIEELRRSPRFQNWFLKWFRRFEKEGFFD